MTYVDTQKQKEAQRRYYESNRDAAKQSAITSRAKRVAVVTKAKSIPCVDCGKSYPHQVMDLHHIDSQEKDVRVSRLVRSASMERLKAEIAKCIVLCANCHRLRHI